MHESTSQQGMKSATPNQYKTTVLRQMKFQENIHKDKTLWSCNIRKKLQEALEYTDKILAAGLQIVKSVYISSKNVDDTQLEMPSKQATMAWSKGLPPNIPNTCS